jgi:hypothetical protein
MDTTPKNYPFKHWSINNIPFNARVAIYGAGEIAKIFFLERIKENREDIIVECFLDTNSAGVFYDLPLYKYSNKSTYNVDYIIIASMFWPNIIRTMSSISNAIIYKYNHYHHKLVIVDHDKKIIFRRNARTGSGDIGRMMLSEGGVQSIIDINDSKYNDYFSFSFVRHPTTKFLSAYFAYIIEGMKLDFNKYHGMSHSIDFFSVLSALGISMTDPDLNQFIDQYMPLEERKKDPHFWGQKWHLGDTLQFVGKLENMEEDFNKLTIITGAYKKYALKHTAPKTVDDYINNISNNTLIKIEQLFEADYSEYNYPSLTL